ncbi:MAG: FtsX-like permease family protein [Arcobacteraceae bacterium]|nr:FtsX-like permease family protein [Arcobacteraceae bacterium]
MKNINIYLFEFSINSLLRQKTKNIFVLVLFTILIFLVSSVFQISNGLKKELLNTVDILPEITIQKLQGGRTTNIEQNRVDELLQINGISYANGRVWGYYYFANKDVYFTLIGIDQFEEQYKQNFEDVTKKYHFDALKNGAIVGDGVLKILKESFFDDSFNFIKPNGDIKEVQILGTFGRDTTLETNDVILLPKEVVYEIFDLNQTLATDIVVNVENIEEIETIALKIRTMFPDCKVYTKDDLKRSYEEMFHYKGGLFLALFIVCLFSFFMIIYDKSSGLNSEEKREIGILKAVGWSTNDILKWKFYEGVIISLSAFLLGFIFSFFYVYILKAPYLKDLFLGTSSLKPDFNIPFELNLPLVAIVFFICIPIYIAATIFPSWRASVGDTDEVLR